MASNTKHKTLRLTIDLETLCLLWENRKPAENLDDVIERFILAGLKAEGKMRQ
jgi:hypothetical protein